MLRKLLITAVAVFILSYVLPGVSVASFISALIVAVVLGLLRLFVKPILVVLTLPVTIVTLGLFLFVINALIVLLADYFVDGFTVKNLLWALLFSLLLSFLQSVIQSLFNSEK